MQFLISYELNDIGLAVIRIGTGLLFIGHGYLKLINGVPEWKWTGKQMTNLGINFAPIFWGVSAMLSELLGGISLTLGLGTRIAAAFMSFVMFVAVIHHIKKGDGYGYISFPLSHLIVFIGLIITGSGMFSLDYYFFLK
ncbi:DoxX family protein [Candidatus Dependentiae bacterium]|nr:DoxX family protein [Candidatus Dependentiae bacterium]